jgi:acetyl esterase/lipase
MNKAFSSGLMALAWLTAAAAVLAQPAGPPPGGGPPGAAPPGAGARGNPVMPPFNPLGKEFLFADFKSPALKLQYPGKVEASFYVTYATVMGTRPLKMDIYRVPNAGLKPAIIFVHGGSYVGGDPRDDRNGVFGENDGFMAYVASRGYVVAAVRYRLADEARWPAQLQDVKAAIRWLRANAEQYGVDPQRVAVWGESAGGHIAAMVGATCGIKEFDKQENKGIYGNSPRPMQDAFDNQSSCVQVAVPWHPSTDMARLDSQSESFAKLIHNTPVSSQSRVLGCSLGTNCDAATVQKANALYYVSQGGADKTAFLFQVGSVDEATPWQQSQIMVDALRAKGIPAQIEVIKGANHYFNGATKEQAKQVLDTFFKFLDENLNKAAKK